MTGTYLGRGRGFMDFDTQKNQEWLRRRKLRLEQVRRQSNEIARTLRQKVVTDEKVRLQEYDRVSEMNFRDWKAEKLDALERKLRYALEDFGEGYKLAEAEPDADEIIEERNKINFINAQRRGEIAQQEAHRMKKMAEEKKKSPIQRKKLTRKKEDLRSALIRTVPIKKQFIEAQEDFSENCIPDGAAQMTYKAVKNDKGPTTFIDVKKKSGKLKKKKGSGHKSHLSKSKKKSSELFPRNSETVWINLNEIQSSSTGESGLRHRSTDSFVSSKGRQREKPEGTVEFYDFSSRFHCRSYREFPHLIERVQSQATELNATELAEIEDENAKEEARKREEAKSLIKERGMEALRREKISREYNTLISKLEDLQKKEKILKVEQRNQPTFLHMTEERLAERFRTKQRIMDSKFEEIYQGAFSQIPASDSEVTHREAGGDWARLEDRASTSFSICCSSNLKPNTPVVVDVDSSGESSSGIKTRRLKKKKEKELLKDIEKTLKEGRDLRKTVSRNRDVTEPAEGQNENFSSDLDTEEERNVEVQPVLVQRAATKTQECQTENLQGERVVDTDVSLPPSTSTCYKSPPSIKRSSSLQRFLDYLGFSEFEDFDSEEKKQVLKKKIDKLVSHLKSDDYSSRSEENEEKSNRNQSLEYYIGKLLTMSRECVANLSVSSENISTPNITDPDLRDLEAKCHQRSSSAEELIRQSRLNRAEHLEEMITNWRRALEEKSAPEPEDEPDCLIVANVSGPRQEKPEGIAKQNSKEALSVIYSPKIKSRYDEITKKCSERISELSQMLDRVRKDKEKLLSSASGSSSLNLSKDGEDSDKDLNEDDGEDKQELDQFQYPKTSPPLETFVNRYNFVPREETISVAAIADSQSRDPEESLVSWPDVMEELLKRKILTSPFKWSDGEYSSELATVNENHGQPSSIETVIGNFRKEINKIKPFTVSDLDSFSQLNSSQKPRHDSEEKYEELFSSPRKRISPRCPLSDHLPRTENSVESINQALTSLGLNWAKSFLRKNEESKAISSSSDSERKSSESEEDGYP